jgi:peptidoglycan/xylan/chitin deacetylase (PgdA/CDA1 family)
VNIERAVNLTLHCEEDDMRLPVLIAAAVASCWSLAVRAQQPLAGPQPGLKWTEQELITAGHHVRAGRTLTPKSWPNGARMAVCLTFDPDNLTLPLLRGTNAPVTISEGEYSPLSGMPRILRLLDRYSLPATFYVPAVSAILHPDMMADIVKSGRHEVGLHGWIHENPIALNDREEEWRLMSQAVGVLEKSSGKRPTGIRSPYMYMSPYTLELLKRAGLLYDTTLASLDEPYELELDGRPTGIVELPANWLLDDAVFLPANGSLPSPRLMLQTFKDDFDVAYREGTLVILILHPHVTGHRSRIRYLEELLLYMKSKPGVWFATANDVARYVKQAADSSQ